MFTSFALFMSLIILLLSGVVLFIFPEGGNSGFIREFAGLTKPAWLKQHIIFSIAFVLFSFYHLFFINRAAFVSYLIKNSAPAGRSGRAELLATMALTVFIALGTSHSLQPFSGILDTPRNISFSTEGNQRSGFDAYRQRTAYLERNRHQEFEDGNDGREGWSHHRDRGFLTEENAPVSGVAVDYSRNDTDGQTGLGPAPDDELHRRTKASCVSCH